MSLFYTMFRPLHSRHNSATISNSRTFPDPAISPYLKLPNFNPLYLAIAAGRKH